MKLSNICIIRVSESKHGIENQFEEILIENFVNLAKIKVTQVQEAQSIPIKMNTKRTTAKHIIIKIADIKDKERILRATRER